MTNEDLKLKLIRLTALADGTTNEHEAATARAQLAKLMAKHGFTSSDLAINDDSAEDHTIIQPDMALYEANQIARWRSALVHHIGELTGVFCWYDRRSGIWACRLVGPEHGIQSTRYLFAMLERDVERLARQHKGKGRTWLNNYRHGVVATLCEKLTEAYGEARIELRAEGSTSKALLRLESAHALYEEAKRTATREHKLSSMSSSRAATEPGAYDRGREDGRSVSVGGKRTAMTAAAKRLTAG